MTDPKYVVEYHVKRTRLDGSPENPLVQWSGGCDVFIFHAICYGKNGRTEIIDGVDSRKTHTPLDEELFKSWMSLGLKLMESKTLVQWQKGFVAHVFETFQAVIITEPSQRKPPEPPPI